MGPYNENGELWDCTTDDIDVCNGRFFDEVDGSYRYVTTETFPYTVGCWGQLPSTIIQAVGVLEVLVNLDRVCNVPIFLAISGRE